MNGRQDSSDQIPSPESRIPIDGPHDRSRILRRSNARDGRRSRRALRRRTSLPRARSRAAATSTPATCVARCASRRPSAARRCPRCSIRCSATGCLDRSRRSGPGYLAFIPGGGVFPAALADLITNTTNRFTGIWQAAPALVQLEANALDWLREWMDFPPETRGLFTTGGSMATWNAILCARERHLGAEIRRGVLLHVGPGASLGPQSRQARRRDARSGASDHVRRWLPSTS